MTSTILESKSFLLISCMLNTDACSTYRWVCRTAPAASTLDNVAGNAPWTSRFLGWSCRAPACPACPASPAGLGRTIRIGRSRRGNAWPAGAARALTIGATCHGTSADTWWRKKGMIKKIAVVPRALLFYAKRARAIRDMCSRARVYTIYCILGTLVPGDTRAMKNLTCARYIRQFSPACAPRKY